MKGERFKATILAGHKGSAFEVPFDPAVRWNSELRPVRKGRRGHPVEGTIDGIPFRSVAVPRMKRFFVLVTDEMREATGAAVGDEVKVVLRPAQAAVNTTARKPLSPARSAAAIERVRRICLALPDASEKISHGEPTWFAAGRVFAMLDNHHHAADRLAVWCPAPDGAQRDLVGSDASNFFIPPYVGKGGWIGVRIDGTLGWPAIAAMIHEAHRLTVAKGGKRRKRPAAG